MEIRINKTLEELKRDRIQEILYIKNKNKEKCQITVVLTAIFILLNCGCMALILKFYNLFYPAEIIKNSLLIIVVLTFISFIIYECRGKLYPDYERYENLRYLIESKDYIQLVKIDHSHSGCMIVEVEGTRKWIPLDAVIEADEDYITIDEENNILCYTKEKAF